MANIGVALELDQLVLTRGRDFKWTFENLDDSSPPQPVDFPDGDLFFELSTHGEHNGRGHLEIQGADGGTYKLGDGIAQTAALTFDISQDALRQAIEGLPSVGVGNVNVGATFTPQWIFVLTWNSAISLSAGTVQLFNTTVEAAFNALDFITGGLGVTLDGHYTANTFTFKFTYRGTLLETELVTFVAGAINSVITAIQNAIVGVEQFTGFLGSLQLHYCPVRHYEYEFVNDRALTPMPALTASSSLVGVSPTATAVQDAPGRAPFTIWPFEIDGSEATIKVESEEADSIPDRTRWQLVFMPDDEAAGGDAVARGAVRVQAER